MALGTVNVGGGKKQDLSGYAKSDLSNVDTTVLKEAMTNAGALTLFRATAAVPASGWSGSGPYTQTVQVTGLQATDIPMVDIVVQGETQDAVSAELAAYGCLTEVASVAGAVELTCWLSKPDTDFTVQIEVLR